MHVPGAQSWKQFKGSWKTGNSRRVSARNLKMASMSTVRLLFHRRFVRVFVLNCVTFKQMTWNSHWHVLLGCIDISTNVQGHCKRFTLWETNRNHLKGILCGSPCYQRLSNIKKAKQEAVRPSQKRNKYPFPRAEFEQNWSEVKEFEEWRKNLEDKYSGLEAKTFRIQT